MQLVEGCKVVCALEGGYVRSILADCVSHVISSLLDRRSPERFQMEQEEAIKERNGRDVLDLIDPRAATNIRATISAHKPYWRCLRDT